MKKYTQILTHIVFWGLYISYFEFDAYVMSPSRKVFVVSEAIFYTGLIWVFYFSYFFLTKNYYKNKNVLMLLSFSIFSFLVFCLIEYQRYGLRYLYAPNILTPRPFEIKRFLILYFFDFILYTIYGAVFWLIEHNRKIEKDKIALLHKNHEIELKYLKAKLSIPITLQFFENLYKEALNQSKPLAEGIDSLAKLMNFSARNSHYALIALEEEIKYTNLFIQLNQQRFNEKLLINFKTEGNLSVFRVPHLCVLTLVENAFKHGNLKLAPLDIIIKAENDRLAVSLKNMKQTAKITNSTGIGLENLKSRLSLLLHNSFTLETHEDDTFFYTKLTLKKQ